MKNFKAILMVAVLIVGLGTWAHAEEPNGFGGVVVGGAQKSATVESIDPATRNITLKDEQGEVKTIQAGPEIRNFDQIHVGDTVTASVVKYAEVVVIQDQNTPLAQLEQREIASAPLGATPAGTITNTVKVMAVVNDIDYAARKATIQTPAQTVTIQVGPEAINFDKVKKGDNVYLHLQERMQIAVSTIA